LVLFADYIPFFVPYLQYNLVAHDDRAFLKRDLPMTRFPIEIQGRHRLEGRLRFANQGHGGNHC